MKSLAALLLLGAIPAFSFVVPNDETAQRVFGSQDPLDEVQEVFEIFQEGFESKVEIFVEEFQDAIDIYFPIEEDKNYAETAIDDAFEEYLDSQPNEDLKFWDTDAWIGHFRTEDLEGGQFEVMHKKHKKDKKDRKKHTDHKDHKDHKKDPKRKHHKHGSDGGHDDDGSDHGHGHVHKPKMPPRDHTGPHTNSTIWDLISKSKHTKRFYELLKEDKDIVDMLQNKDANHTVFAPSNHAFEVLDKFKKYHDIPKDLIRRVLMYHIAPGRHRSQDLRYHNTLITSLPDDELGKDMHQRVRIGLNHKGPSINFYSQFTMLDIYANNGIIHGIDAVLLPPPEILDLVEILPTEFSTTEAALSRTGLLDELPKLCGKGLTVFAPSNCDWKKLGFKINAFLFSDGGNKYLRALMKYHIVPDHSLYSDALVSPGEKQDGVGVRNELDDPSGLNHGYSHVDLPTLLKDRRISVDITRLERFLSFRVNGLTRIVISDGIAKSGVIQVPDHVLIPPHSLHDHYDPPKEVDEEDDETEAGTYSLDEFKRILEPFVEQEQRKLDELERLGRLRDYEL